MPTYPSSGKIGGEIIKLYQSRCFHIYVYHFDLAEIGFLQELQHFKIIALYTTYTLIKRCIKKGAIARSEPGFMCHALVSKSAVQEAETDELINKIYDGSADKLFAALLGRKKLSEEQIQKLKQIVGDLE